MDADVLVVGGGPAGMMAGYLFARAGVHTIVLEKHKDFLRDFRGDTVHPSTINLMDELGLLEKFLQLPHARVSEIGAAIGGKPYRFADFSGLPAPGQFIALMPQWDFLDFLAGEGRRLPAFDLRMEAEAETLIEESGRVTGVTTTSGERFTARLTIAADGRGSRLRDAAQLPLHDLGAPIDVFWFRVPKTESAANQTGGNIDKGEMVVTIDRGDYWQCARVIGKGEADAIRALGIARFRDDVASVAPSLANEIGALQSFDDVKLLSVSLNRLTRWHRPGLLAIGDAAHAMSPVGGVGINLAIQDAVAAANILAGPMAQRADPDLLLAKVQERREFPVRVIQGIQRAVHHRVIGRARATKTPTAPLVLKLFDRFRPLRGIPARILGLGVRREHMRSPKA
jgi:2-polyprenyl-6-methoxyphenol hydroxylase-like FAD-dependent oxidoreductase